MLTESPGVVFDKEYSSSVEKPINILKRGQQLLNVDTLPSVITPKGLNAARKWYLYDEIGPFCKDTSVISLALSLCNQRLVKIDLEKRNCQKLCVFQKCNILGDLCTSMFTVF